jgi:hypothetical protein
LVGIDFIPSGFNGTFPFILVDLTRSVGVSHVEEDSKGLLVVVRESVAIGSCGSKLDGINDLSEVEKSILVGVKLVNGLNDFMLGCLEETILLLVGLSLGSGGSA